MSERRAVKRGLISEATAGSSESHSQIDEVVTALKTITQILQHQVLSTGSRPVRERFEAETLVRSFLKLSPPEFQGLPDPVVADAWRNSIEKVFDVMGINSEQRVPLAVFMLKGEADHWWRMVCRSAESVMTWTWEMFLEKFEEKYFPDSVKERKLVEFLNLVQGDLSVAQYEAKFAELSRYAKFMIADEVQRANKFQRGLKSNIRSRLIVFKFKTYDEVVDRALLIELDDEEVGRIHEQEDHVPLPPEQRGTPMRLRRESFVGRPVAKYFPGKCHCCKAIGHKGSQCPNRSVRQKTKHMTVPHSTSMQTDMVPTLPLAVVPKSTQCLKCGGFGHLARACVHPLQ